jgi:hypothetical protein
MSDDLEPAVTCPGAPSARAGVEPKAISQMVGHATVAFTMDV